MEEKMKQKLLLMVSFVTVFSMLLASCGPTPTPEKVVETVIVQGQPQKVVETVIVQGTPVEKVVEKVKWDNNLRRSMPALPGRCPDRRRCVADGVRDGCWSR